MSGEICTDNRFEIIAAYKKKLIEGTNIQSSPEEMAVIDNILFRFWQMRWLPPIPHGRLIDADALRQTMYHEAFETDSPMQKWDGGCWIRYKMFERMEEAAPTIIPAEEE